MILYSQPYNTDKNLGKAYNQVMELLPGDDDYCCFTDADSMFTTYNYGHQIADIVKKYPEHELFTAMAGRLGKPYQLVDNMWGTDDIRMHRAKGAELQQKYYYTLQDVTDISPISGVLILLKKRLWLDAGGFEEKGMLGIDNSIHYAAQRLKRRVMLMKGVYLYHWYRGGNRANKGHLL